MYTKYKKISIFPLTVITTLALSVDAFAWLETEHKRLAEVSSNLKGEELKLYKYASAISDDARYYYKTRYKYHSDGNYFTNYVNLTKDAVELGNGGSGTDITSEGIKNKNGVIVKWDKVFKEAGISTPTNKEMRNKYKKLFAYGMALHLATDVFSHQSYEYKNQKGWVLIPHESGYNALYKNLGYKNKDYADDPKYNSTRIKAAEKVAANVFKRYKSGGWGDISDLWVSSDYFGKSKFYINNYYNYSGYNSKFIHGDYKQNCNK